MATHELQFKASVDMSQANAQIQSAAKGFNIGLVRQAVNLFGNQLSDLASNAGLKEFAEEVKKATSAASDAIGVWNATRNMGSNIQAMATAASLATSALLAWGNAVNKSIASMDRATKIIEDANTKQTNQRLQSAFAGKDLSGKEQMAANYARNVERNEARYNDLLNKLNEKRSELASKGITSDALDSTTRKELDSLSDAVEAARAKLEKSQSLLEQWNSEIASEKDKIAKDLERAAEAEKKERERIAEAAKREAERLEEQKNTTAEIFRQFDKSEMFDAIRNSADKNQIAQDNIKALEKVIEGFRNAASEGKLIDNDALREALSDLAVYRGMLDKETEAKAEEEAELRMAPLNKTLEAMSGLAAIGGSVAGESAQASIDTNIAQTMKFVQQILDNTRQMNDTLNS